MLHTLQMTGRLSLQASQHGGPRRFSILAYSGGELRLSGYDLPVIVDLAGLQAATRIPILIDHATDADSTLGQTNAITNTGRELQLSGIVTGVSDKVQRVLAQAGNGHSWQASIGATVGKLEEIAAGQPVRVNGQDFTGPVYVARKSILRETSVLPMGADPTTSVNLAAAAAGGKAMSFEQWLTDQGIDPAKLTPAAKEALMAAFDAEVNGAPVPASAATPTPAPAAAAGAALDLDGRDPMRHLRRAGAAEMRRQGEIRAKVSDELVAAKAIEEGWTVDRAELEALRRSRPRVTPVGHIRSDSGVDSVQCLSAGLMIRAGHESLAVKAFGERNAEAARRRPVRNMMDLAAAALQMDGREVPVGRDQMIRAAFSTTSLPTILADTVGRTLVGAYEETTSDWRKFCYVASADDFRQQTGIRPASIANLDQLAPHGEIKHGVIVEEATYTWAVNTFAKMVGVDRTTIVNDDLGFIATLAPMLGQAAGRSLNDLIWQKILANAGSFFHADNANLITTSALAVATLGTGVTTMRSQRDSKGVDLNIAPIALAVPPGLELTARNLLNSAELLPSSGAPTGNPVKGIVPNLIVEPRLANTDRFTGASSTTWYLFGGPNARAVTVGFLQSQQAPQVETEDAPFHMLGIQMRVVFDFGCALSDPKGALKAIA